MTARNPPQQVLVGNSDHGLNVTWREGDRYIYLAMFDDWMGDTQTGLGAEISLTLNIENVRKLRDTLDQWILAQEPAT